MPIYIRSLFATNHVNRLLEVGIIANGIEIYHYNFKNQSSDEITTDLRSAYLHAIIMYKDSLTNSDISYLFMRKMIVLIRRYKIEEPEGDIIFYLVISKNPKSEETGWELYREFEPRFSNFYNYFMMKFGEKISSNMDKYAPLNDKIEQLFVREKKQRFIFKF